MDRGGACEGGSQNSLGGHERRGRTETRIAVARSPVILRHELPLHSRATLRSRLVGAHAEVGPAVWCLRRRPGRHEPGGDHPAPTPARRTSSEEHGTRRRRQSRGLVSYFCSHFAPITPRNRVERDEERRIIRQRGTVCCRTPFLQDQRVTGHGRLVLITQRSLVQIQPPQPLKQLKPKGPSDSAPLVPFDGL